MARSNPAARPAGCVSDWLFAPANPTWVAVFRVLLCLMLLVDFWPGSLVADLPFRNSFGLEKLYEPLFLTWSYWALAAAMVVLFGAGWRPRLMGGCAVVLLFPLLFLSGSRQSRQVLWFVLIACSLLRPGGPMWPIRLIQFQLSVVYGVNAIAKTTPGYLSGEVLMGMSNALPNFLVDLSSGYAQLWFLRMPVSMAAVLSAATEYTLALGFWFRRTRPAAAVLGVGFHLMLKQIVRIHMLDWTSMFLYLAFFLPFHTRARRDPSGTGPAESPRTSP